MNTTRLDQRRTEAARAWETFGDHPEPMVFIGAGSCGRAAGAMKTREAAEQALKDLGVKPMITEVGCIGPCYLEPLLDVKMPGKPRVSYGNVTPKKAKRILREFLEEGIVPKHDVVGHFGDDGEFDGIPRFYDHTMLKPQVRLVLRNCGLIDPSSIDHYLARGGYEALQSCLSKPWEDTLETVKALAEDDLLDSCRRVGKYLGNQHALL